MLETLICVLIGAVVLLALSLLIFLAWREAEHKKQVDELTSKIICKTLPEYTQSQVAINTPPKPPVEKPKHPSDPVLGNRY